MAADEQKRSHEVRCGALVAATAATFLLLTGCDSMQSRSDEDETYDISPSGHVGGQSRRIYGGGMTSAPKEGLVRGGFGKTGAMHASSS